MDAVQIIREFGLPTMVLVVMGYGLWQCSAWIARELIVPMRDRHFAFLNSIESTLNAVVQTQQSLVTTQQNLLDEVERVSALINCPVRPKDGTP